MTKLDIQSARSPFDDTRLAAAAIAALTRADAMGLLSCPVTCLDDSAMQGLETGMTEAGIGRKLSTDCGCGRVAVKIADNRGADSLKIVRLI